MIANVNSILEQIQKLSEDERLILEQRLTELAESEWRAEAAAARQLAQERGVTQAVIDEAISQLRYGR
jgi:pimeloyl-CoA synthetase